MSSDYSKYFDYNATTPMRETALRVWQEMAAKHWQNPSSLYREAAETKHQLEYYREGLADVLDIDEPDRIVFTSGATEANNAVIRFLAENTEGKIAISAIEHPCVTAPFDAFVSPERQIRTPVDANTGAVSVEDVSRLLSENEVAAVSVMAANNETGVIQPWEELAELCTSNGVLLHTDAAQWIGKLPSENLGKCDFLTGSGHKFGGGKGVGFLVLPDSEIADKFHMAIGGPQEEGKRAGTENLPAIAAMVEALAEVEEHLTEEFCSTHTANRDHFESQCEESLGIDVIGKEADRLWNTSMIVLPHTKNLKWLTRLSHLGFSVSTGSACSAGKGNPSEVMQAMGLDFEEMGRVLRISGGWDTSAGDWKELARALTAVEADLDASVSRD